jgi:hypothetical protein
MSPACASQCFATGPIFFDGTLEYERAYLAAYRDNPGALLVGAFD